MTDEFTTVLAFPGASGQPAEPTADQPGDAPKDGTTDEFKLESGLPKGEIPQRVVDELVSVREIAKDYAQSYSDAIKAQGEKHGIPVGALKRYVAAVGDNKLEDARNETDALEKLLLVKSVDPIDG